MPRYADWKAPDEDGQILIWPPMGLLLQDAEENNRALRDSVVRLQHVPIPDLRRQVRALVGIEGDSKLVFATGHQTELYHPGVWAKDVLIDRAARRAGGLAVHISVDTDSPKHLHLRWPGIGDAKNGAIVRGGSIPITDDPRLTSAPWAQLVRAPSPEHIVKIHATLSQAQREWDFEPMVFGFLQSLMPAALDRSPLPAAIMESAGRVSGSLDVKPRRVLASSLWCSAAFCTFAHHFLARAGDFAADYNRALREYRIEQGISSPGRPMPDLAVAADHVETPFWLDDLAKESRKRLSLARPGNQWRLDDFVFDRAAEGHEAGERLAQWLKQHQLRISPRALMLTMFLRLLLADQFVHGIGGARYDQVTDRILDLHFGVGMTPPHFAVTTATLYFPAARGHRRINLHPLLQEGRRLRHGSFWAPKRELAQQIALAPRRSAQRRELFYQMHNLLAQQAHAPKMQEWARQMEEAGLEQARQRVLFDRELFFAIQPQERLREVIARYDGS